MGIMLASMDESKHPVRGVVQSRWQFEFIGRLSRKRISYRPTVNLGVTTEQCVPPLFDMRRRAGMTYLGQDAYGSHGLKYALNSCLESELELNVTLSEDSRSGRKSPVDVSYAAMALIDELRRYLADDQPSNPMTERYWPTQSRFREHELWRSCPENAWASLAEVLPEATGLLRSSLST